MPLVITALLIRFSIAELVFYVLKKRKVMVAVCSFVLAALFTPHCFSMAVALGILLVASVFYPSREVRSMVESPDDIFSLTSIPGQLVANYY
jgi:Sec-independent protein secretion pathway component TatC